MIGTPPPAPQPVPLATLLSRSWVLFRRNWIIALPPVILIVTVLVAIALFFVAIVIAAMQNGGYERGGPPETGAGFFLGLLALVGLIVVVGVWAQAAMFGMADAAWAKGTTSFGDGFAAFRRRGVALVAASFGVAGLALVAVVLALPTLGLALLALPLATMYVVPSVVAGGRDGFVAVGESVRLVWRFFGTSAIVLLVLLGIQFGIGMLGSAPIVPIQMAMVSSVTQPGPPRLPAFGYLVFGGAWFVLAMIAAQAYTGYYALVLVGLYRSLFAQPVADAPPPPAAPLMPA